MSADSTAPAHAYTAYERAVIGGNARYVEKFFNVIVVVLALVLNLLLAFFGATSTLGAYALLVFLFALYAFDAVLAEPHVVRHALLCQYAGAAHTHTPLVYNETAIFVGVWLLWWISSTLLTAADCVFERPTYALLAPLVVAALLVAWADVWSSHAQMVDSRALRRIVDASGALLLLALAFPSAAWAPQRTGTLHAALRVAVYFGAVFAADFALGRSALCDSAIDNRVEQLAPAPDKQRGTRLCATLALYEQTRAADRHRAKRIVALTGWLLVAPLPALAVFAPALVGSRYAFALWLQRRNAPAAAADDDVADYATKPLPAAADDAADAAERGEAPSEPLPELPIEEQAVPRQPPQRRRGRGRVSSVNL